MEVRAEILILILLCMAVTVIPRIMPMVLVNKLKLPKWFLLWLEYVPVAVLSALFFKEVLLLNGEMRAWDDPFLIAGLLALGIAFIVRNIFLTVLIGMGCYVLIKYLLN